MDEQQMYTRTRRQTVCMALLVCAVLSFFGLLAPQANAAAAEAKIQTRYLVPVGRAVGIKLFAEGVLVVGFSEGSGTEKSPAKECGLREGDIILTFNETKIESTEHLQSLLQENGEMKATMAVRRGAKTLELTAHPETGDDGVSRLGAWIRDSMAGIGTMTFYEPASGLYGALGHGINDVDTAQLMPLQSGALMEARVKAVKRGEAGDPGELRGDFTQDRDIGTLHANTDCGIFGTLERSENVIENGKALPAANADEIKVGEAYILANCDGEEVCRYSVAIEKVYAADTPTRNMLIRVTDDALIEKTGGIVQGMSGSPIIQDGKLVGAVTHVLVNDPTRGYGIFIENMLEAAS